MKAYSGRCHHGTPTTIALGGTVLYRQKKNKLSTMYNTKPYTVTQLKGSITAARNGHSDQILFILQLLDCEVDLLYSYCNQDDMTLCSDFITNHRTVCEQFEELPYIMSNMHV